jgi:hypothetical protein
LLARTNSGVKSAWLALRGVSRTSEAADHHRFVLNKPHFSGDIDARLILPSIEKDNC